MFLLLLFYNEMQVSVINNNILLIPICLEFKVILNKYFLSLSSPIDDDDPLAVLDLGVLPELLEDVDGAKASSNTLWQPARK